MKYSPLPQPPLPQERGSTLETSLGLQKVTIEKVVPYSGDQSSLTPLHLSALYLGIGTVIVLQLMIVWTAIRSRKLHKGNRL